MRSEVEGYGLWCWAYMRFGVSWCCNKILTGVDGACRRQICELSPGGYRGVLDASHAQWRWSGCCARAVRVYVWLSPMRWPRREQSQRKPTVAGTVQIRGVRRR